MENKPIEIIVRDERGEERVQGGGGSNTGADKTLNNAQSKPNNSKSTASMVATMVAMRSISYATSNVGKWTGNSQNQAAVDFITRATGYAVAFASNVYVGIATVALDSATYAIDYTMELYWNKKQEAQAQARSGGKGGYRR